jgi:glycosyltransferase involved in cell wall biosynthesis
MNSTAARRVDLLHYAAPPVVGGVESVLERHARLMLANGCQVRILAGRGNEFDPRVPFISVPLVDSLHPDILAAKDVLDHGEIPANFNALVDSLLQTLAEITAGTDILIAHNVASLAKNLALTAALYLLSQKARRPKLILWQHDLAWTTPRYRQELHPGYPWDLLRTAWPGVLLVTVSQGRKDELATLLGIPESQIHVIPNGVDYASFYKLEQKTAQLVRELNLLTADPLLLLPVRLTPRKNIEFALQVVAALKETHPDTMLVVTGPLGAHNPDNVQYLEHLLSQRAELNLTGSVHFLAELDPDYLPDPVIADFYRLADALFLPSKEEGFGIPLIEAGFSGLPIFCSDIPPFRELGAPSDHAQPLVNYFSLEDSPIRVAGQIDEKFASSPEYQWRMRCRREYSWEMIYHTRIAPLLEISGG